MASEGAAAAAAAAGEADATASAQATYDDLKRLTPLLAAELDHLRASLREHNLWLQRYGQGDDSSHAASGSGAPPSPPPGSSHPQSPSQPSSSHPASSHPSSSQPARPPQPGDASSSQRSPPPPLSPPVHTSGSADPPAHFFLPPPGSDPESSGLPDTSRASSAAAPAVVPAVVPAVASAATPAPDAAVAAAAVAAASGNASPPPYSASDVPDYSRSDGTVRYEVEQRRDQLMEWLKEGEDLLRDYSARFAQLADELHLPAEDVLGTWNEAASDNALPGYTMIETREELMVGNVGEVPPNYVRSPPTRS